MLDPKRELYRWGPISGCPLFMYYTIKPSFDELKNLLGVCYPESLIIFKNQKITWLLDEEGFVKRSQEFVYKIIDDPEQREKYFKLWDETSKKLEEQFGVLRSLDKNLSGEELEQAFWDFSKVYYDWWKITLPVELATVSLEPRLGQALKTYFPQEHPKDLNRAFSILTAPFDLTFYRKELEDLLRIIDLPEDEKAEALRKHQREFYWVLSSY